jgi:hypothetical protein
MYQSLCHGVSFRNATKSFRELNTYYSCAYLTNEVMKVYESIVNSIDGLKTH